MQWHLLGYVPAKCVADELPFHDCSTLSSRGTSDSCLSLSSSGSGILQFNLLPLSFTTALRVAHLNCRSLLSNADEVSDYILFIASYSNSIDVFAITETWLDSSIEDSEIFPYSIIVVVVEWLFCSLQASSLRLDLIYNFESLWIELPYIHQLRDLCCSVVFIGLRYT